MMPTYLIAPHERGGYALTGPKLPWRMWWKDEALAAGHAGFLLRDTGGRIVFEGARGWIFTEHVPAPAGGVQRSLYAFADAPRGFCAT